jgi:hypothetical protein
MMRMESDHFFGCEVDIPEALTAACTGWVGESE